MLRGLEDEPVSIMCDYVGVGKAACTITGTSEDNVAQHGVQQAYATADVSYGVAEWNKLRGILLCSANILDSMQLTTRSNTHVTEESPDTLDSDRLVRRTF